MRKLVDLEIRYSPALNWRCVSWGIWRLHEWGRRSCITHRVVGVRGRQDGADLWRNIILVLGLSRWCRVLVESFVLCLVGEQDCEVIKITNSVRERTSREIFSSEWLDMKNARISIVSFVHPCNCNSTWMRANQAFRELRSCQNHWFKLTQLTVRESQQERSTLAFQQMVFSSALVNEATNRSVVPRTAQVLACQLHCSVKPLPKSKRAIGQRFFAELRPSYLIIVSWRHWNIQLKDLFAKEMQIFWC